MRRLLEGLGWGVGALVGALALAVALLFAINATDQPLSEEAQAALRLPPLPAPSERNAYLDFLALGAPADAPTFETGVAQLAVLNKQADAPILSIPVDPQVRRCNYGAYLACVSADPRLKEAVVSQAVLFKRYRAMRTKPEFTDLQVPASPEDPLPAYLGMTTGHRLSLLHAALEFNAGRRAAALAELEADFAFYRVVAAGSGTLLPKMIAFVMLDGDTMFAAELARNIPVHERALWKRLEAMLRPMTQAELDVMPAVRQERAQRIEWMRTRKHVRLPDAVYQMYASFGSPRQRPWWDPLLPYLYRPNYSVNLYVAQGAMLDAVAARPSTEFSVALVEALARADRLEPPAWERFVLSPARINHEYLGWDYSDYIARAHVRAGIQSLVALQARLRAARITQPADIEKALAGPLGRSHPRPLVGGPMDFDAKAMTLGFPCVPKHASGIVRSLIVDGKLGLPL